MMAAPIAIGAVVRLASRKNAQMAEQVDALVSNTNNFTVVPVRPRLWVLASPLIRRGALLF